MAPSSYRRSATAVPHHTRASAAQVRLTSLRHLDRGVTEQLGHTLERHPFQEERHRERVAEPVGMAPFDGRGGRGEQLVEYAVPALDRRLAGALLVPEDVLGVAFLT